MFKAGTSARTHWNSACKRFSENLNFEKVAAELSIPVEVLRNKLDPEHPVELSITELMTLSLTTGDTMLIDGMLAQMDCLPSLSLRIGREKSGLVERMFTASSNVSSIAIESMKMEWGDKLDQDRRDNIITLAHSSFRDIVWFCHRVEEHFHKHRDI